MLDWGRKKIAEAKQNGQWNATKQPVTDEQFDLVEAVLKDYEPAYSNFMNMSCSVKKTYTKAYLDAETDEGRRKRTAWMVDWLNKNAKPM